MLRMTAKEFRDKFSDTTKDNGKQPSVFRKSTNKFRNRHVKWSGVWRGNKVSINFDSQKECDRAIWLIYQEKKDAIRHLDMQKAFLLIPKSGDERKVVYRSDFYYFDVKLDQWVMEDVKSEITKKIPAYIIKRKLVKMRYPKILFKEV